MANTSLLTEAAKEVTRQTVNDFGGGVFGHIFGDFGQHTQIRILNSPYTDNIGDQAQDSVSAQRSIQCRILTSEDVSGISQDKAVLVPIFLTGTTPNIVGQPPVIIQQPQNQSKLVTEQMYMSVFAISNLPLTYQWQKDPDNFGTDFVDVAGQNQNAIVLTDLKTTNAGRFRVRIMNSNGTTISSAGTLAVSSVAPLVSANDDDFSIPFF